MLDTAYFISASGFFFVPAITPAKNRKNSRRFIKAANADFYFWRRTYYYGSAAIVSSHRDNRSSNWSFVTGGSERSLNDQLEIQQPC